MPLGECPEPPALRGLGRWRLRALDLFGDRPDKAWGLTDCISFVAMADHGLTDALTSDLHFPQAGLNAMLLSAAP